MIGRTELPPHPRPDGEPCNRRAGNLREIPGEHVRRCHCGATFIAVITVAVHATAKCGREVLKVDWHTADREPVT